VGAACAAQRSFCSCSGKSPAKEGIPVGFSQTRPSATSICEKISVAGNFSCRLCGLEGYPYEILNVRIFRPDPSGVSAQHRFDPSEPGPKLLMRFCYADSAFTIQMRNWYIVRLSRRRYANLTQIFWMPFLLSSCSMLNCSHGCCRFRSYQGVSAPTGLPRVLLT
jgi:hypothetical protein